MATTTQYIVFHPCYFITHSALNMMSHLYHIFAFSYQYHYSISSTYLMFTKACIYQSHLLQVQRTGNFGHTFKLLWAEEKLGILSKGLSPRLFQSVIFSFTIILGYESVKRVSVSEEYKDEVKW